MADLNPWLVAALAALPPLAVPLAACARGGPVSQRFVAAQLATTVALLVLAAMTFVFAQPSSIDLAWTLGLLSLPATLLFAVFLERWL